MGDGTSRRPLEKTGNPQKKKDQLALAQYGDKLPANRPDPDDPGGLGAEESGTERTGPTQAFLFAMQDGGRWAEVGRYYDSANDPVTPYFPGWSGSRTVHGVQIQAVSPRASCSRALSAQSCR
jgi:hypothetical protein